jgi:hypothetical protein
MTRELSSALLLCAVVAIAAVGDGCGRKSAPHPPEDVLPETIEDLEATPVAAGIDLSWSRPRRYTGGDRMPDLGGFEVHRADAPGAPFETVATIQVTDLERFQQTKRFHHLDIGVQAGERYLYRVVSFTLDRYVSAPSNIVSVVNTAPVDGDATQPASE